MEHIIYRTLLIYFMIIVLMNLLGKRQLGELEIPELLTTLFLSEIAVTPITNPEKPIMDAVIPMLIVVALGFLSSYLQIHLNWTKPFLGSKPTYLIVRNKLDYKALKKTRITIEEFLSELRQNHITDIMDVEYAILEHSGKLSTITKDENKTSAMSHALIIDGKLKKENLKRSLKSIEWLDKELSKRSLRRKDVFIFSVSDKNEIFILDKSEL